MEPVPVDELDANTVLAKIGRTTGYTEARFSAVIGSLVIKAELNGEPKPLTFSNIIEVEWADENMPFTKPGDSGKSSLFP